VSTALKPLDHGVLSIPGRTGTINAELDRYKTTTARNEAAARKAASTLLAQQRIEAKRLVAAMTPERVAELAAKCKTTPADVRSIMKSNAHWQPALVIKAEGGAS
jgi:hypothetical protein